MNDPQMSLLASVDRAQPARESEPARIPRLGVMLDHRTWLSFLADGWWPLDRASEPVQLGVGRSCGVPVEDRIAVTAWFDPNRLADIPVPVLRDGRWRDDSPHHLQGGDEELIWPGPLPLFAVTAFSVPSPGDATRLVALAKGLGNVGKPEQAIEVDDFGTKAPSENPPQPQTPLRTPHDWNAMRGAAAMAVWAVPAIDPWLDLLSVSLSRAPSEGADAVFDAAPWWRDVPWRRSDDRRVPALWTAMLDVFGQIRLREGWRANDVLDAIRSRLPSAELPAFDDLDLHTRAILSDRQPVDPHRGERDPLGLILQLLLLRPGAERFETWKDDLLGMPPSVWWTGAMLAGAMTGYRDLPLKFRGLPALRSAVALRTWQLSSGPLHTHSPPVWPCDPADKVEWRAGTGIQLIAGDEVLADRGGSSRGRWYRADLGDTAVRTAAIELAHKHRAQCVFSVLKLHDRSVDTFGAGTVRVEGENKLVISGLVNLRLDAQDSVVTELDEQKFRGWIGNASIQEKLVEPPGVTTMDAAAEHLVHPSSQPPSAFWADEPGHRKSRRKDTVNRVAESAQDDLHGLSVLPDFISAAEEDRILREVDAQPWLEDLARRVQHYGWKYDYGKRKIDRSSYLGQLPDWAARLGARLLEHGVVKQLPDQVIVNEYVGQQGISRHKDCLDCFVGAIVTVSLCETWSMVFRGPKGQKVDQVLPRYSAVVLDGEARTRWTHEIPKRKREPWGLRERRVSLTFRKVAPVKR